MRATLVALAVVWMTLLAGGGRCMSDYVVANEMEVMVGSLERGGPRDELNALFTKARRHCACMELTKEGTTREELCQCIAEIRTCDEKHRPTRHTSENQYSDRLYKWMTCLGEDKLPIYVQCRNIVVHQPLQMMCQAKALHCE
ncbi:uncharacterized protein LOC135108561 isoform X2 [Scylla paramamosain]|uniref:uncharacterized protein LOC135108561 isoform X2 n=1 Tax=Scylla paramamosain TaxID=85552 RepID=UPI003082C112